MADPVVKPDPDAPVGSPFMEDVLDESTDLEFFDKFPDAEMYNKMYLARLPSYLWEAWSKLDDDAEIEIGKIRQWSDKDGNLKLQMRLHPNATHQGLPKEYNLEVTNPAVHNMFVFTEQDLPSYAAKNKERANALAAGIPAHLLRQQQQNQQAKLQAADQQPGERSSRRPAPYTRKAIPKKTAIRGRIKHEVLCTPAPNAETEKFLFTRTKKTQETQRKMNVYGEMKPVTGIQNESQWIKISEKPTKAKKMENKATRWPENQLLDAIAKCFSDHKYWSVRAFRNVIPQPEAYLRETLEKIAVLHRSGSFANHWSLKPEYQGMLSQASQPAEDAAAPAADLVSDEEDEDVQMEDVL